MKIEYINNADEQTIVDAKQDWVELQAGYDQPIVIEWSSVRKQWRISAARGLTIIPEINNAIRIKSK